MKSPSPCSLSLTPTPSLLPLSRSLYKLRFLDASTTCMVSVFQEPPERPKGLETADPATVESLQLWAVSGESCPEGTVPIRRTTEADMLRASSLRRFGRKPAAMVRRDSTSGGHEVSSRGKWRRNTAQLAQRFSIHVIIFNIYPLLSERREV